MQKIIIDENFNNARLDRFLRITMGYNQSFIHKALRNGKIKLNGKKTKAENRVQNGDELSLFLKFDDLNPATNKSVFDNDVKELASELFDKYLIADEEDYYIINKKTDLSTQGGNKVRLSIDHALKYLNQEKEVDLKLVHRLDKDTSGLLIIAKNRIGAARLGEQIAKGLVGKKYLAITEGAISKNSGVIRNYLTSGSYQVYVGKEDDEGAKLAVTKYKVIKKQDALNLVEFDILTGRKHQIRVHAATCLQSPIIGDGRYNESSEDVEMMLHAHELTIENVDGKVRVYNASIPDRFILKP